MSDALYIVNMQAENVKRIRAVDITPRDAIVNIAGKNGQGKTSILDAIAMTLEGRRAACDKPVRLGEERARAVLDLGDYVVTSTWKGEERTGLKIETKGGSVIKSPQAVLDAIVGAVGFDPLRFANMKPKDQRDDLLSRVPGLDKTLEQLSLDRQQAFDQRTDVNRGIRDMEGALAAIQAPSGGLEVEVSVADLVAQVEAAQQANAAIEKKREAVQHWAARVVETEQAIERMEAELRAARDYLTMAIGQRGGIDQELNALVIQPVDALKAQIANAEATNRGVRERNSAREQRRILAERLKVATEQADALTERIAGVDEKKAATLRALALPVEGLTVDDDGVLLNGVPFSQAAMSAKLLVGLTLAMSSNPRLRVCLLRDGSLLDDETREWLYGWARTHDVQLWIETVGEGDSDAWVIVDGSVAREPAAVSP